MINESSVAIHVGIAKSASTTLQKQLFDKHPEINFLGIYPLGNIGTNSKDINKNNPYLQDSKVKEFHSQLVQKSPEQLDHETIYELKRHIEETYFSSDNLNLFSNERFTSVFFSYPDIYEKANRLKELFPNAIIIFLIRNQLDVIKSQYRDHPFDPNDLIHGKPVSIEEWIDLDLKKEKYSYIKSLDYNKIINYYETLFGKEHIGVFLFEDLVKDLNSFSNEISNFCEIDKNKTIQLLKNKTENTGVSSQYNKIRQLKRKMIPGIEIKKFIPSFLMHFLINTLKTGKKHKIEIEDNHYNQINNLFKSSNSTLQKKYNLNLSKYNYPLD
jgi:hypothetical protein